MIIKFIFILFFILNSFASMDFEEYQKNHKPNNQNTGIFVDWINNNFQKGLISGEIHRSKKYCFDILEPLYNGKGINFTKTRKATNEETIILKSIIDTIFGILKNDDIEFNISGSSKLDNSNFLNERKNEISKIDKKILEQAVNSRKSFTLNNKQEIKYQQNYICYSKYLNGNNDEELLSHFNHSFSTNGAMKNVYNTIFLQILNLPYLNDYLKLSQECDYNQVLEFFKKKDTYGHYKIFSYGNYYLDERPFFDMIALTSPARMMYGYDFGNQMLEENKKMYLFPEFHGKWNFDEIPNTKIYNTLLERFQTFIEIILKMGYNGYTCSFSFKNHATTFVIDKIKKQILVIDPINAWYNDPLNTFKVIFDTIKKIDCCKDFEAKYVPIGVQTSDRKCVMWSCIFLKVSTWFGAHGYKKLVKAIKDKKILKHSDINYNLLREINVDDDQYEKIPYDDSFKQITRTLVYDLQESFLQKFLSIVNKDSYSDIKKILDDDTLEGEFKSVQIRGDDYIDQSQRKFYEETLKNRALRRKNYGYD